MRYIGNKQRLLPFILGTLRRLGIRPGSAHDAFAGTAAVGRALKAAGWRVASSDVMMYSYVFQRAYVVAQRAPSFADLRASDAGVRRAMRSSAFRQAAAARGAGALGAVAEYLTRWLDSERGFIAEHFAPPGKRMYFSQENAERIDAVRRSLHEWRVSGTIDDNAYFILLAALLEASDRVANTAGVYAAYIKSWQPNARRPLEIIPEHPLRGQRNATAHHDDAAAVARGLGPIDLLYIDPPYNARQYTGYYHVPEIIARGWFDEAPRLRGKTGLPVDRTLPSAWCSARRAAPALSALLDATSARHVLVSYNTEGLLPDAELRSILADVSADGIVRRFTRGYRRYRADSDREGRRYRGDSVKELLYYARLR